EMKLRQDDAGLKDLDEVQLDLNKARSLTAKNASVFQEYFRPSLKRAIEELKDAVQRSGEPATGTNRPNGQLLAQLCVLILASGTEWPADLPWDACSNAHLESIYPASEGSFELDVAKLKTQLEGQDTLHRMCAFHKFRRASRVAEILRQPEKMSIA